MFRKPVLTIAAACLVAAPMAFAHGQDSAAKQKPHATKNEQQGHRSTAEGRVDHRVDYLTTVLSLTNSQREQAKKIFMDAENENSGVFANLRAERGELAKAVRNDEPASRIKDVSDKIGTDAGKLVANFANASEQFRKTLTPEQQTKLTKLQQEEHGWMGMGLHGPAFGD
jgi:Spy/CpxP family protein refolding chaperone